MNFGKKDKPSSPPPFYTETPEEAIELESYFDELSNFRSRIKRIGEIHKDIPMDLIYTALNIVDSSKVDQLNIPTHFRFQFIDPRDHTKLDYIAYEKLKTLCKKKDEFDYILIISRKNFIENVNSILERKSLDFIFAHENDLNFFKILFRLKFAKLFISLNGFIVINPTKIKDAFNSFTKTNGCLNEEKQSTSQIEPSDIIRLFEQALQKNFLAGKLFNTLAVTGINKVKDKTIKINFKHDYDYDIENFHFQLIEAVKCDLNKVLILRIGYTTKNYILKSHEQVVNSILHDNQINHQLLWVSPSNKYWYHDGFKDKELFALVEVENLNKMSKPIISTYFEIENYT